ncbi:riboflavin transporter MCH5 [Botrytis cinerea]
MSQQIGLSSDVTRGNAGPSKSPVFPSSKLAPSEAPSEFLESDAPRDSEWNTRSCIAVIGAFSIMFCSVGFINAFGVFQEYYAKNMLANKTASEISWLGSFNVFCMFGGTFVAGYLNDKYGPKFLVYGGSVVILLALFMTSICKEYYQFFLAQGFLLGIGIASILLPAFTIAAQHFTTYRGLALGIVVSGSSLGGVIWPIALNRLLTEVGFGWAYIFGLFTPFFYIEPWALSLGLNSNFAFYTISIVNAASLFGRIIPGLLADRFGCYNIAVVAAISSGLVCTCMIKATSVAGITMFSLAYGFASGAIISLQGVCAAKLVPPTQFGIAMGSVMTFLSIAGLVGSPINGKILDVWGYLGMSLFSGMMMLLGGLVLLAARLQLNSQLLAKA